MEASVNINVTIAIVMSKSVIFLSEQKTKFYLEMQTTNIFHRRMAR